MSQPRAKPPIQAVIFDYGGVLRHDARDDFDAIDYNRPSTLEGGP